MAGGMGERDQRGVGQALCVGFLSAGSRGKMVLDCPRQACAVYYVSDTFINLA